MADQKELQERYNKVKQHKVCPDCGSDVVEQLMTEIDPKGAYLPTHIGLKCTGEDLKGKCKYYIFAGETRA